VSLHRHGRVFRNVAIEAEVKSSRRAVGDANVVSTETAELFSNPGSWIREIVESQNESASGQGQFHRQTDHRLNHEAQKV